MAQVDPDDDDQRPFVVFHYRYDPDRRERRPLLVAAFDETVEFQAFVQPYHADLQPRIREGRADPRQNVSGVEWEPGDQCRARERRPLVPTWRSWSRSARIGGGS